MRLPSPNAPRILAVLLVSLCACVLASAVTARTLSFSAVDTTKWTTAHEETESPQVILQYNFLTDNSMKDTYGGCFGIMFESTIFGRETTKRPGEEEPSTTSVMVRPGIGLLFAEGEPLQKDAAWTVNEATLSMIAMPLTATTIIPLTGEGAFYAGLGIGFYLGFERINGNVENIASIYEWHDTCYRHSFSGHVLLGAYRRVFGRYSFVGELRWTQGGKGRLKRGSLSEDEIADGWGKVFDDFQHSDFNFTGLSVNVGLRW